jgi:hypothetical protein
MAPAPAPAGCIEAFGAIVYYHRSLGHAWQPSHTVIRQTLAGIAREHRRPVRPAAALTSVEVKRLIAVCPGDLSGLRDRALFLVGLAGAFRRAGIHLSLSTQNESVISDARLCRGRIVTPSTTPSSLEPPVHSRSSTCQ